MRPIQVGLGLWSMRSSVYTHASWPVLYRQLLEDAALAEELGYDTLWLAEHHFWYDGWCPQPLVAASAALGVTEQLRVGTAMYLLPQHDAARAVDEVATLRALHGNRLDLGVGLGYRDEEYDGVAVLRAERGRRMSHHLDALLAAGRESTPPIYVGGMADAAIRRAGRRGLGLLLPNTLKDDEVVAKVELAASEAQAAGLAPGRVGMLIDAWIETGGAAAVDAARDDLARHYREYAGAWYMVGGRPMFASPDLLDRQSVRTRRAAVIGTPEEVLGQLRHLGSLGVDTFVLQIRGDHTVAEYREMMHLLAVDVVPALRELAVAA